MCQGDDKTNTIGTNAIFVMEPKDVPNIPKNQPPTYVKVIVAYRPKNVDPYQIRITAVGNLINYPGELTTRTADMTTAKLHWNSVLSTPNARYMCLDIGNFYLSATLDHYKYMKMPIGLFPPWIGGPELEFSSSVTFFPTFGLTAVLKILSFPALALGDNITH